MNILCIVYTCRLNRLASRIRTVDAADIRRVNTCLVGDGPNCYQINEKREQVKYERRMVLILSRLLMRERSSKQWYCSEYPLQQCESNGTDSEDGLRSGNI